MAVFAGKTDISDTGSNVRALLNKFYDYPGRAGNIRMVYSGATGAANGVSPGDAYTTLIAAQTGAVADNDDVVYVLPGHVETVVGAAGMTFSKAGVTYIGVGNGYARPTISFTTSTAAQILVTGARITFKNLIFDLTGVNAIVAAILVSAVDVAFEDCEFVLSGGTNAPVLGILTAATATRLRVEGCRFVGPAVSTSQVTACIQHEVGTDYIIRNNYFAGKMTQAFLNATTLLRGLIDGNRFVIGTGTVAITMAAASTPFIVNNRINVPSGTAPIVAAAGFVAGNIYSAAAGVTAGTASTI